MAKRTPPHAPEFRQQIVELVRAGRTPEELTRERQPSAQTIHKWVRQADRDDRVRANGPTSTEQDDLRRLRREQLWVGPWRAICGPAGA